MMPDHGSGTAWTASLDDYAYLRTAPRVAWAWEFLRRHPEYRRDYEAVRSEMPPARKEETGVTLIHARQSFQRAESWGLVLY
jgi:hypothetical protein